MNPHYQDGVMMKLIMENNQLTPRDTIDLLILIMVFSGVFGFVYEELFYRIDLGTFVKRGSSFGPWIPIYFFGGAMFALLAYRFRDNPLLVFLVCVISSGILEYVVGAVLYNVFHTRLWDYNTEIWNWGNVNGYVCLRSVLFFGISGLALIYIVMPLLTAFVKKYSSQALHTVCIGLLVLFFADIISYQVITHKAD